MSELLDRSPALALLGFLPPVWFVGVWAILSKSSFTLLGQPRVADDWKMLQALRDLKTCPVWPIVVYRRHRLRARALRQAAHSA